MPTVPIWQVDSFTHRPFTGNPAGVCLLESQPDDDWMAAVAAEMNVAETAFTWPSGDGRALRWWSPTVEVALCGHATLATAHVLWESGTADGDLVFTSRTDVLRAERRDERVRLDFPTRAPSAVDDPTRLLAALGLDHPVWVGRAVDKWLVEVADPRAVAAVTPDMAALVALGNEGAIVTAAGGEGADFVSRFFAPAMGIDEDPVTGSSHCVLAPYWAGRLGRDDLRGHQISARGGWVDVELRGDRVGLLGRAVTVLSGTLRA